MLNASFVVVIKRIVPQTRFQSVELGKNETVNSRRSSTHLVTPFSLCGLVSSRIQLSRVTLAYNDVSDFIRPPVTTRTTDTCPRQLAGSRSVFSPGTWKDDLLVTLYTEWKRVQHKQATLLPEQLFSERKLTQHKYVTLPQAHQYTEWLQYKQLTWIVVSKL